MHYVYKYIYEGKVIYIGKSDRHDFQRLKEHGKKQDNIPKEAAPKINAADIYVTFLANSTMSDVVESELIRRYNPPYNKDKKSEWVGLDFAEPKWIPYRVNGIAQDVNPDSVRLNARETENEKYDYYNDFVCCVGQLSEKEYQIAKLNEEISCLKVSYGDLINRLKEAKTENEELAKTLSTYKLLSTSKDTDIDSWMKLYDNTYTQWKALRVKYDNLLKRYTALKSNAPKESVSFWQKLFAKRKETK